MEVGQGPNWGCSAKTKKKVPLWFSEGYLFANLGVSVSEYNFGVIYSRKNICSFQGLAEFDMNLRGREISNIT
jgi:hypothetical protein